MDESRNPTGGRDVQATRKTGHASERFGDVAAQSAGSEVSASGCLSETQALQTVHARIARNIAKWLGCTSQQSGTFDRFRERRHKKEHTTKAGVLRATFSGLLFGNLT